MAERLHSGSNGSQFDRAIRGLVGVPKSEVEAEAKKEQRRKTKSKKPKREDCPDDAGQSE